MGGDSEGNLAQPLCAQPADCKTCWGAGGDGARDSGSLLQESGRWGRLGLALVNPPGTAGADGGWQAGTAGVLLSRSPR